jgi:branched-chain amino acid transport system substrate-binding protein
VLFVTSTEIVLADPSRGSFLVSFSDNEQGSAAGEFAAKQGFITAVTLTDSAIPYFNDNPTAFAAAFTAKGGTVVEDLPYSYPPTDFSEQVSAISALAAPPDVIYSSLFLPEIGTLISQLRAAGINSVVMGADGMEASEVWTLGPDAEGVVFTGHTFPSADNDVASFLTGYTNSGAEPFASASFGALGADAALIAAAVATAACSTDGPTLIAAMSDLTVEVVTGTTSYAGTNGSPKRNVSVLTVTNGEPTLADSFYPATLGG